MLQASCVYALNFEGGCLDHVYANITLFLMHRLQQPASADVDASYRPLLKSSPSASSLTDSETTPPRSSTTQAAVGGGGGGGGVVRAHVSL